MRTFLNDNRSSFAVPIDVTGHDATLNPYLCGTVQRRLAYALGRFEDSIRRIHVRLSDVHAPRGGETSCQIELRVLSNDAIIVTASDARLDCAITKAAHAAARRVDELYRRRERRGRQSKLSVMENALEEVAR